MCSSILSLSYQYIIFTIITIKQPKEIMLKENGRFCCQNHTFFRHQQGVSPLVTANFAIPFPTRFCLKQINFHLISCKWLQTLICL